MNIYEILITVGLTVAAAAVIAYTTFKIQTKHRERALFRALLDEVNLNITRAQVIKATLKSGDSEHFVVYPGLRTEAYDNARLAGVLLSLKEDVRERVHYLYEMIVMHNREISAREGWGGRRYDVRLDQIIKKLKLVENDFAKEVRKPTKRSDYAQESLLPRYIMLQVSIFFSFGLLSIYAYYLAELDSSANMSMWSWVQNIASRALVPIGIASIAWAIILSIVGLNCKVPRILKRVREKIAGFIRDGKDRPIVYVASLVVFGVSFITTWADLSRTDIGVLYRDILLGIAVALIGVFVVDNILRARHRRAPKNER